MPAAAEAAVSRVEDPSLMKILYCTDVEGNWDYFVAFIQVIQRDLRWNGALAFESPEQTRLILHPGYIFVFGGDVGDKGAGTLRIVKLLVQLKTDYPDRVVLIAGNRDINKMRWTSEFTETEMNLSTMDPGIKDGPHWLEPKARANMSLRSYLCKDVLGVDPNQNDCCIEEVNTKVNRMLWMLKCTMGSDGDFERRRQELAIIQRVNNASMITDDDVMDSFLSSVQPGGLMYKYLQLCVLGFYHGTTLFVHGGVMTVDKSKIMRNCLGLVPPFNSAQESYQQWVQAIDAGSQQPSHSRQNDIRLWIQQLNAWYTAQVNEWIAYPTWNKDHTFRGGENLQNYVHTNRPYSVVSGRHLERSSMPCRMTKQMTEQLWRQGLHRMIIGHTPHGNAPTVVKHVIEPDKSGVFEVIMCDTSYSDVKAKDMRGSCVSLLVVDDQERVWIQGHIAFNDGDISIDDEYGFSTADDPFVGHALETGEWIKTRLDPTRYLLCTVNTYHYTYKVVDQDFVAAHVKVHALE
ncbi:hypothetical protein LEN26_015504 [Aphanomyces euteiches]|nr:hypothetical protein LEN26_015504 [Aphanomyces euteiches]KAH9126294.1 hypothetical protein AeMF1_003265 [Aphanomyces euteiches]KAH9194368.1 hypothetical protein AeNC1_003653 [Aphanomyces euteiches]